MSELALRRKLEILIADYLRSEGAFVLDGEIYLSDDDYGNPEERAEPVCISLAKFSEVLADELSK